MPNFGGKRVGQIVRFSGNGIGQVLVAVDVTLLVRLVSFPGPALSADDDCEYEPEDVDGGGGGEDAGDDALGGEGGDIRPVTIKWRNVTCSLSDKKSKPAEKVMETLRQLAEDGHTVISSIYQPRGSVYYKFDDILLLTGGALVYTGPARDEPLKYFSKFGNGMRARSSHGSGTQL